jgi:hypothetical protein
VEFELEVLKEKRDMLTKMLLDLMEKKKQRAEDLQVVNVLSQLYTVEMF